MDKVTEEPRRYRAECDAVDQQFIACLATRFRISQSIGMLKRERQAHVYQHDRENDAKERYATLGFTQGLPPDFLFNLFKLIQEESCRIQGMRGESFAV